MNADRKAMYTADEFAQESRYLETLVWEALGITSGMRVLLCGYGPDAEPVARALGFEADVTVIEHRDDAIGRFSHLDAKLLRGSTSVIPAKENAFDLAIAFHYLHEIDPFFHAQVLSELARVARRVALVEPAPPADALGKRIALLYSQAKRELGQFEYYQPLEYWKKLLHAVKADVSQHVFAFAKVPPREYLADTIELLLHTIEVEQAPREYVEELRKIAQRSDLALLPPPRYVLVGAAAGELPEPAFSTRETTPAEPVAAAPSAGANAAPPHVPAAQPSVSREAGYEFPPVEVPAASRKQPEAASAPGPRQEPDEPPPAFVPGLPFGAPPPPAPARPAPAPFGAPFAVPPSEPFGAPPAGIPPSSTWQWEPPDSGPSSEEETPFGPVG
jgi:hypothetical protein